MAAGIKEIGKHLGLSPSTVSRVLNNKQVFNDKGVPFISKTTQEKVLKAAKEMGYRPHIAARALVRGETQRIAFWVPQMGHRYFQEIAHHFQEILMADEYEMIMGEMGPNMLEPDHAGLARANVDGVIIYGGLLGTLRHDLEKTYSKNTPVVNMGAQCVGSLDYVEVDLYPAACEAAKYLCHTGRNRIAHLTVEGTENDFNDPRYRAYTDVIGGTGNQTETIVVRSWTKQSARQGIISHVRAHGHPDALICDNDDLAIGALRGLRDLDISIPREVAIIGSDGIEETEYFDPPITTIVAPQEQMCRLAWQALSRRIAKPDLPQQKHTVTAKLELRASSGN